MKLTLEHNDVTVYSYEYDGFTCPMCGSSDTGWRDPQVGVVQSLIEQEGHCLECNASFELVFRVTTLRILEEEQ